MCRWSMQYVGEGVGGGGGNSHFSADALIISHFAALWLRGNGVTSFASRVKEYKSAYMLPLNLVPLYIPENYVTEYWLSICYISANIFISRSSFFAENLRKCKIIDIVRIRTWVKLVVIFFIKQFLLQVSRSTLAKLN